MNVLIIANTRYKGGISGGDAIYESFVKYWKGCQFHVHTLMELDYKPFFLCYIHRIILGIIHEFTHIFKRDRFDIVYSSSDFLPDVLPALVHKMAGKRWVAGYYLTAFKSNKIHYYSQKIVRYLIDNFADMVIVTNPTMFDIFKDKKKTWINGGIDMKYAGISDQQKEYDAVFCGRIHSSKGIDELIEIWNKVISERPHAKLAIIGDGDLGKEYIEHKLNKGVDYLGYMGDERYDVYRKSKVVLYPVTQEYDHFSMAPVEAMACGCPMLCYRTNVIASIAPEGTLSVYQQDEFVDNLIMAVDIGPSDVLIGLAYQWAIGFDYKLQSQRVFSDIKGVYENTNNRG